VPHTAILLPPSEGKAGGGDPGGTPTLSFAALDGPRKEVAGSLAAAMADRGVAGKILGVKGEALAAAVAANTALDSSPVLPAIDRYTGVLYDHLDSSTLRGHARRRLTQQVIIVSGLWGLVRAGDLIPDYKLKVDASLPDLGRLSRWWRPRLSPVLDEAVAGGLVFDLLPGAHASAWADPDAAPRLRVTASFAIQEEVDGAPVRRTVTHWSKALKGCLARYLLEQPAIRPTPGQVRGLLEGFTHPDGYRLRALEERGRHLHAELVAG
jgi:uncharacterized protein